MRDLPMCVNSGIGAPSTRHDRRLRQSADHGECIAQHALHGSLAWLNRPPRKVGAVVREVNTDTNEPAVHGGISGLVDGN